MGAFLAQLRWELRRMWRRPRTYVGFAAALVFEVLLALLYRTPQAQAQLLRHVWRVTLPFDLRDAFSALPTAVEVASETLLNVGALFLALAATDVVARELEDGTLRMALCRPVSRTSVLLQKLVACAVYTAALVLWIMAGSLALGLVLAPHGKLVILVARDGIAGTLDFWPGLTRYALAAVPNVAAIFTVTLLAFTLSCFPVKPGTALALAVAILFADWAIHLQFLTVSPYCLATRLGTWRQFFNDEVPWLRIRRNFRDLAWIDVALVGLAWVAFVRRPLTAR